MGKEESSALLKKFYALQEERVETYSLFDESHKAYLKGAPHYNFPMYQKLVEEITQAFVKISKAIIDIQKQLDKSGHGSLAKIIAAIQQHEKRKLQLTVKLQLAAQNAIDQPESRQQHELDIKNHKKEMRETIESVNEQLEELRYEAEDLLT